MRQTFVNLVTLVRVPVIILLAVVVSPDDAGLAAVLLAAGIISHWSDGVLVRWFKLPESKPGEFWHDWDTGVLSLGLQHGAGLWLYRADELPLWAVPVYAMVVLAIQFGYVAPRQKKREPFKPIVLFGSFVVWAYLVFEFAAQADIETMRAVLFLFGLTAVSAGMHSNVWLRWKYEWDGEPDMAPPYRS